MDRRLIIIPLSLSLLDRCVVMQQTCPQLECLGLACNRLKDQGLHCLSRCLATGACSSLRELDISVNEVRGSSAVVVFAELQPAPTSPAGRRVSSCMMLAVWCCAGAPGVSGGRQHAEPGTRGERRCVPGPARAEAAGQHLRRGGVRHALPPPSEKGRQHHLVQQRCGWRCVESVRRVRRAARPQSTHTNEQADHPCCSCFSDCYDTPGSGLMTSASCAASSFRCLPSAHHYTTSHHRNQNLSAVAATLHTRCASSPSCCCPRPPPLSCSPGCRWWCRCGSGPTR